MESRQPHRPGHPQLSQPSSAASSVFQSSASLSSISSSTARLSPAPAPPSSAAPLPSPSTTQPAGEYFGAFPPPPAAATHQPQQQQGRLHTQHMPAHHVGQRGNGQGPPETAPFLRDFSLLAEAAKRAQMACLSRDLGDIGI